MTLQLFNYVSDKMPGGRSHRPKAPASSQQSRQVPQDSEMPSDQEHEDAPQAYPSSGILKFSLSLIQFSLSLNQHCLKSQGYPGLILHCGGQ